MPRKYEDFLELFQIGIEKKWSIPKWLGEKDALDFNSVEYLSKSLKTINTF